MDAQQHIAAIRAALKMGSTRGAWFVSHECRRDDEAVCDLVNNTWVLKQPHIQLGSWEADAAHIAACHPEAMRAILAHIEALEADAERLNWMIFHSAVCLHSRDGEWCRIRWVADGQEFVTAPFGDARSAIDAARKEADRG